MFYWNEEVNLPKTRYSVDLGLKPPPASRRWEPSSGGVRTGDCDWAELLAAFQSVALFGKLQARICTMQTELGALFV